MSPGVLEALAHAYERWDGKGFPDGLAGDAIPLPVRIAVVARDAQLLRRVAPEEADDLLRARRGRAYDPTVVDALFALDAPPADGDDAGAWQSVVAAEPGPGHVLAAAELDRALGAVADFTDLASPFTRGHSARVAELAEGAARSCRLPSDDVELVRRAGLVHDVGSVGVPGGVWNHPGPLDVDGWERVRLHSYLSERVLAQCDALAPLARLAGSHHERGDGSGYHRGLAGADVAIGARILAAADALAAMGQARPHRPARSVDDATTELRTDAAAGRLDTEAVEAVLAAAGQSPAPTRRAWPAGLTDREVEVLRLVARGQTNRQMAGELHVSAKTVGRHIENLYAKIGVSSRAAAAVFAMEERLLDRA